jgi:hypothetical protein
MDHEEGVGGSDSALPTRKAQPVVSHTEALDETSPATCCCIPSGVLRPFTSMRGGSNIDYSQRNVNDATGDQQPQAGQRPSRAPPEAQTCACFLTIVERSQ